MVRFDGSAFSLYLDGSDLGLAGYTYRIDALSLINPNQLLLSFSQDVSLPGINGTVRDADVVRFTATSLGENTQGTFEMYLDGSDVGLSEAAEGVDALVWLPNGHLLLSTKSNFQVLLRIQT